MCRHRAAQSTIGTTAGQPSLFGHREAGARQKLNSERNLRRKTEDQIASAGHQGTKRRPDDEEARLNREKLAMGRPVRRLEQSSSERQEGDEDRTAIQRQQAISARLGDEPR